MTQRYDVAIAGGAVMGSAVAYFLAADADFDGSIAVVERDPGYEACATTRSWGGIRQQFSTPENVKMSLYGAQFVRRAGELLEVDGERPDLGFKERGYLFLASPAGLPVLERYCAMQRELGAAVAVLEPAELAERFPWLNLDGLAGAGCGLANEGWFDPSALLHGFRRKARALGVAYVKDEVVSVEVSRGRVTGLGLRAAILLALSGFLQAPVAAARDVVRVESVGVAAVRPDSVSPRDAAVHKALLEAVRQTAEDLLAARVGDGFGDGPGGAEDLESEAVGRAELQRILGNEPLEYATRFQVVEDRGEGPALFGSDPNVETEYVVIVSVFVDRDRIRERLARAGIALAPVGPEPRIRSLLILEDRGGCWV
ncbi:MAG: FAD-binding oxidoreductase, partial [Proteobacteria bacterium]|nr:FAD-binding oxidoreductase [Pseudomonadota bacterium]